MNLLTAFQIFVSFSIVAFGTPSLSGILSSLAAACGLALFWSATNKLSRRFWIAFGWFTSVQAIQLNWMVSFDYMGYAILLIYLLVIVGLGLQFGILTRCITLPLSWRQILGLSGFWALMEWSRLFFLSGFPWNPIGLTLSANSYSIQFASCVGVYGLCFWVIFVNLVALKCKKLWVLVAVFPYLYGIGHQAIVQKVTKEGKTLTVALVQPALRPEQRNFFPDKPKEYLHPNLQWDRLLESIKTLPNEPLDLIVFPEGALAGGAWQCMYHERLVKQIWTRHFGEESLDDLPLNQDQKVSNAFWIQALANHFQADVIVGLDDQEEGHIFNSAFHFGAKKKEINRYQKQILIPMGEYIPMNNWNFLVEIAAQKFGIQGTFSAGKQITLFHGPIPMGAFICLEEAYSQFVRNIRLKGAELFVNLTNDVWFPNTRLPWHHFDHGRLRCVENGVCLLRSTNTGVTGVVDCFGQTIARLPPSEKEPRVLFAKFPTRSYSTIYTFIGSVPILLLSGIFCLCWLIEQMWTWKKKLL